jgi:hypothetical protein
MRFIHQRSSPRSIKSGIKPTCLGILIINNIRAKNFRMWNRIGQSVSARQPVVAGGRAKLHPDQWCHEPSALILLVGSWSA